MTSSTLSQAKKSASRFTLLEIWNREAIFVVLPQSSRPWSETSSSIKIFFPTTLQISTKRPQKNSLDTNIDSLLLWSVIPCPKWLLFTTVSLWNFQIVSLSAIQRNFERPAQSTTLNIEARLELLPRVRHSGLKETNEPQRSENEDRFSSNLSHSFFFALIKTLPSWGK